MPAVIPLMVGGLALQGVQQWRAGSAAKQAGIATREAAESEAQLSDFNASVADAQAQDAVQRGQDEESRYRTGVRDLIGSQRAGYAASGVAVEFGSAVDVQADAAFLGELDALTIRNNAAREAWGMKVQAVDLRKRAEIQRKTGAMAEATGREQQKAARIGAATTLVAGAGSLLAQKYGYGRGEGT